MEDKKTVKMDDQQADEQPTVHADASPFVRMPSPAADRPTPRPDALGWGPPSPPGPAPGGEGATMLIAQRPRAVFAWLAVMDGPEKGRIHQLQADVTTVGRAQGNSVVLPDDSISGQHLKIKAELLEDDQQQFVLFDLASSNGTFVGNQASYRDPASRTYRHVLNDGDYLLLGETTLVFKQV